MDFQNTVEAILPITCVIFMWAVLRLLLALLGVETDIQNIGSGLLTKLFGVIGTGAVGAALFLFLSQISWFFGIHGSDMLHEGLVQHFLILMKLCCLGFLWY